MKNYQDFCHSVATQLFNIIDGQGSLLTWQKRWDSKGCNQLPISVNGFYKGANLFMLLGTQWKGGFNSNQWLTFNQINLRGGKVKKGAKSQTVYFWKIREIEESKDLDKKVKKIPLFKTYHVFNLEQTTLPPSDLNPEFRIDSIEALIEKLGTVVSHFGNQAYFDFANDIIVLPSPDRFTSKENYYATLLHELVHWTAKNRVPRDCFNKYHIDIKERAEEELIAEIGSVFLAIHYGIKGELEHHASYIASWKKLLNEKQVMNSVHKATKAFEWIINQSKEGLVS